MLSNLARLGRVLVHLLHQRVEVRELLLVADLRDELHFELASVERRLEIEHMRLEQRLGAVHRGPEPEARDPGTRIVRMRRIDAAHAHRVDAGHRQLAAAHADVRRRKPQPAPELLARDHAAAHRIRTAQQVARPAEIARGQRRAHAARAHADVVDAHRRHQLELESPGLGRCAQQRDAARAAAPEAKILAHHHRRGAEALRQQLDELLPGELPQLLVEAQHAHVVQVRTLEHAPALAKIREPRRRILRHEVLARQRLEGQHHRRPRQLLRDAAGARDQRAVPEVNAIEAADRDGGATMLVLEPLQAADEFHGDYAPATLRMWRKRVPDEIQRGEIGHGARPTMHSARRTARCQAATAPASPPCRRPARSAAPP